MQSTNNPGGDSQDNFVEARDPAELLMCIILAAAYAGFAKYCFIPLQTTGNWRLMLNVEGFFITIALLSLVLGLRPYFSPCSLQLSRMGIKYRGPYWPQRKTVNWDHIIRLYISPELIVALYRPKLDKKFVWPLVIQSIYLADRNKIEASMLKFSPVAPILLSNPTWPLRLVLIILFLLTVAFILHVLIG